MSAPLLSDLLRPYLVEEVMSSPVYTAQPKESLLAAARTMRTHHVSGLPVVDGEGVVVGVLSEKDIVGVLDHQVGIGHARGILDILLAGYEPKHHDLLERAVAALLNGVVSDAMSHPAATVEADAPLSEAWHLLRQFSVNRLPVMRAGRLSGILTRQDVLEILESVPSAPKGGRAHRAPG
jgi:CBS domain-containing protein